MFAMALVRQLRGPHLSTCPWCSMRSSMEPTEATSPNSLPQSSTGRLDVSKVRIGKKSGSTYDKVSYRQQFCVPENTMSSAPVPITSFGSPGRSWAIKASYWLPGPN